MRDNNAILEISTVVGCRMACSYCPQKAHVSRYASFKYSSKMSLDDYTTCLMKVPQWCSICFAGMAEPFLNPDCIEMILRAHDCGHEVSVFTTGYGLKAEDVQKIAHVPYRHFCIHLPDDSGMMKLTVTNEYLDTLKECAARIPKRTFMCIGPVHPLAREATGHTHDGSSSLISRASNIERMEQPFKHGKLKCGGGPDLNHNILIPNGGVLLCCMDYSLQHVIGNLLTGTYESLFESDEFKRIERGMNGDESVDIACRKCEVAVPA